MCKVKSRDVSAYIVKSTGLMVALIRGIGLPLQQYTRGRRTFYTVAPMGPRFGFEAVYDWECSSPVRFTHCQIEQALYSGLVARDGHDIVLSRAGISLANDCLATWGPEIDAHLKVIITSAFQKEDTRDIGPYPEADLDDSPTEEQLVILF
jgi:hypothetical protein